MTDTLVDRIARLEERDRHRPSHSSTWPLVSNVTAPPPSPWQIKQDRLRQERIAAAKAEEDRLRVERETAEQAELDRRATNAPVIVRLQIAVAELVERRRQVADPIDDEISRLEQQIRDLR